MIRVYRTRQLPLNASDSWGWAFDPGNCALARQGLSGPGITVWGVTAEDARERLRRYEEMAGA